MIRVMANVTRSLRGRLLLGTLAWILAAVLVAGWVLADLFRQHALRQLANELAVHMTQLVAGLSVSPDGSAVLPFEPADPRFQRPLSGVYWQVDRQQAGQPWQDAVFHSRSLWDEVLPARDEKASEYGGLTQLPGPDARPLLALVRVVTPPEGAAAYRLTVAVDQSLLDEPLDRFRLMLAVSLGVMAMGLVLAALVQVLVGLRPLVALRHSLARVREGHESQIQGSFPQEVQPLVDEFNLVLKDILQIVERARTQAGNLAHALKSPLSILANAARTNGPDLAHLVDEQVTAARHHVDHHLARARAAATARHQGVSTPVLPVVQGVGRVLLKLYADKPLKLDISVRPEALAFKGEAHDLHEIVGNVVENAFKWAQSGVWVLVEPAPQTSLSTAGARQFQIRVDDDGPGLPQARLNTIFERGVRLDERTPGTGLGLDIVRDLVQSYGGQVTAQPSMRGGLSVRLTLPGSAAQ